MGSHGWAQPPLPEEMASEGREGADNWNGATTNIV